MSKIQGARKSTLTKMLFPINEGVTDMIYKLLLQQSAPDVFDGSPLEFSYFMFLFEEVVESKIEDPRGKLTCLIKFTRGEAKELVKHCIQRNSSKKYKGFDEKK